MKRHKTIKLALRTETIRTLETSQLSVANGGQAYSELTPCWACQPSDRPDHCASYQCSGAISCDAATCTLVTF